MYTPPAEILEKYAQVLINFALGGGEGIKKGETVFVRIPECAKPFYVPLRNTILKAGGNPIMQFTPDDVDVKSMFDLMSEEQLLHFPAPYQKGLIDSIDHSIAVIAQFNKYEMQEVDPAKIMLRSKSMRPFMKWREEKETAGKFTWTLGLYGTAAMAEDVGMSEEEYWQEIIRACFLDEADPVAKWREVQAELERVRAALNTLKIDSLHIEGEGVDLLVGIGENRQWLGGSGPNIPSFELFISPDCRRTSGYINFNQPLYQNGNMISGIKLVFVDGKVTEVSADKNEAFLKELIAQENADMIGEFSLTDGRISRITRVMGETLYDENIGGPFGNTHIAVGNAYKESFPGDMSKVTPEEWKQMGYNESVVHTDIISTTDRTVTAKLMDGSEQVIYRDGKFTL